MRRWDRLVDAYIEEYRGRGTCEATVVANGRVFAFRLCRFLGQFSPLEVDR